VIKLCNDQLFYGQLLLEVAQPFLVDAILLISTAKGKGKGKGKDKGKAKGHSRTGHEIPEGE
jgi:hypothetical protein